MVAVVVPLIPRTTFVFDGLPPDASMATTMVQRMPLFAWTTATLVVRVEGNTLVADVHNLLIDVVETAPTCDDTTSDFQGLVLVQEKIQQATGVGVVRLKGLKQPLPPYADLVVEQVNAGLVSSPGAAIISVDMIVGGRFFDRVDLSPGSRHKEVRG